jgi:fructoselysine-6-P-deglycase FrlB-like protein
VSQGFNRSDARIVVQYASKCGTPILVITAAQAAEYTQLSFEPTAQDERLFCRPVGAITGYVVAARLAHELCSQPFPSISLFLDALRDGLTFGELQKASAIASLNEAETVIVLASGAAQPAAHNVALALREGANKNAVFYEIEYYAHGQYAPHLNAFKKGHAISYVVVSNEQDPVSEAAVQRITPLLTNVGASVMWVSSTRTKPEAVVDILAKGASLVERLLLNSSYDMNSPVGKEENRSFHEVDETFYERCKQR